MERKSLFISVLAFIIKVILMYKIKTLLYMFLMLYKVLLFETKNVVVYITIKLSQ